METTEHDPVAADRQLVLAAPTEPEAVRALDPYDDRAIEDETISLRYPDPSWLNPGDGPPHGPPDDVYAEPLLLGAGVDPFGAAHDGRAADDVYDVPRWTPPPGISAFNVVDQHPHGGLMPEEFILAEQLDLLRRGDGG